MKIRQLLANTLFILQTPQLLSNETQFFCGTEDMQAGKVLPPVVTRCEFSEQLQRIAKLITPSQFAHKNLSACKELCQYLNYTSSVSFSRFSSCLSQVKKISNGTKNF